MREIAYKYFKEQPSYQLMVAQAKGGVRETVLKLWLEGHALRQVAEQILNTPLMVDSVKRCKQYIVNVVPGTIDIDVPNITRDICAGFLDYVTDVYNECETVIG